LPVELRAVSNHEALHFIDSINSSALRTTFLALGDKSFACIQRDRYLARESGLNEGVA
jgi:hypothetical protein